MWRVILPNALQLCLHLILECRAGKTNFPRSQSGTSNELIHILGSLTVINCPRYFQLMTLLLGARIKRVKPDNLHEVILGQQIGSSVHIRLDTTRNITEIARSIASLFVLFLQLDVVFEHHVMSGIGGGLRLCFGFSASRQVQQMPDLLHDVIGRIYLVSTRGATNGSINPELLADGEECLAMRWLVVHMQHFGNILMSHFVLLYFENFCPRALCDEIV